MLPRTSERPSHEHLAQKISSKDIGYQASTLSTAMSSAKTNTCLPLSQIAQLHRKSKTKTPKLITLSKMLPGLNKSSYKILSRARNNQQAMVMLVIPLQ